MNFFRPLLMQIKRMLKQAVMGKVPKQAHRHLNSIKRIEGHVKRRL